MNPDVHRELPTRRAFHIRESRQLHFPVPPARQFRSARKGEPEPGRDLLQPDESVASHLHARRTLAEPCQSRLSENLYVGKEAAVRAHPSRELLPLLVSLRER